MPVISSSLGWMQNPEDGYHGLDIVDTAKAIKEKDGRKYLDMDEKDRLAAFKVIALKEKLDVIKKDLGRPARNL